MSVADKLPVEMCVSSAPHQTHDQHPVNLMGGEASALS